MKKLIYSLFLMTLICCEDKKADTCIDISQITDDACITLWDPVCGCDEKTYGNSCVAKNSGVINWVSGACN